MQDLVSNSAEGDHLVFHSMPMLTIEWSAVPLIKAQLVDMVHSVPVQYPGRNKMD